MSSAKIKLLLKEIKESITRSYDKGFEAGYRAAQEDQEILVEQALLERQPEHALN